jgi:two-component sensor histidine kinase
MDFNNLMDKYKLLKSNACDQSNDACLLATVKYIVAGITFKKGRAMVRPSLDSLLALPNISDYPSLEAVLNYSKSKTLMMFDFEEFLMYSQKAIDGFKTIDQSYYTSALIDRAGIFVMKDRNEEAFNCYKIISNTKDVSESALHQSYLGIANYYIEGNKDSSEVYFQKVIDLIPNIKDSIRVASVYRAYGSFKMKENNYTAAINSFLKALPYLNQHNKSHLLNKAQILLKIGNVFAVVPDYEKAEVYLSQGRTIAEKLNYKFLLFDFNRISALNYYKQNELVQAKIYYLLTLEYAEKKNDYQFILNSSTYLGLIELNQKQLQEANKYYQKGLSVVNKVEPKAPRCDFYNFEGRIHLERKAFQKSINAYELAKEIAEESQDISRIQDAFLGLGKAERASGDYKTSLNYFLAYDQISDSLRSVENYKNLQDLELKYTKAEQEKSIANLNAENEIKDIKLSKAMQEKRFYILGIALLVVSLLAFYRLFKIKTKHNQELDEKNKVIQNALSEKEVLLKEIHHRVKNNLQIISSLLNLQSRHLEDKGAKDALQEGKSRVQSMGLIHQNLYQENNLSSVNMKNYIPNLCESLLSTYQVDNDQVELILDIESLQLDVSTVIPIGLVLNELLTNALKYAFPNNAKGNIEIVFKHLEGQYILKVSDNGIGFNEHTNEGFGTRLINTFSRKLDAKVKVENYNGTSVEMSIPIKKTA